MHFFFIILDLIIWDKDKSNIFCLQFSVSVYYFPAEDEDDEDGPTFKEKFIEAALKGIDIFCVWDCCGCWLKFQEMVAWLVFDPFVELFITLCIVINTLFMALDHHNMDKGIEKILKTGNYVSYCKKCWNKLKLFILVFHRNFRNWSNIKTSRNESKVLFPRRLEHFWFHNCSVIITWTRLRRCTRFIRITFIQIGMLCIIINFDFYTYKCFQVWFTAL